MRHMTNSDRLNAKCQYDILVEMNDRLDEISPWCILRILDSEPNKVCERIGESDCKRCIAKWLNSKEGYDDGRRRNPEESIPGIL